MTATTDRALAKLALEASRHAYVPYSGFAVGAAIRTASGHTFVGANLENASYGITMCAEVAAITAANTAGHFDIATIAVVGHRFLDPRSVDVAVTPCGRCRQMIAELSQLSGINIRVLSCSGDLHTIDASTISKMLPDAFGPRSMGLDRTWPAMQAALGRSVDTLLAPEPAIPLNSRRGGTKRASTRAKKRA